MGPRLKFETAAIEDIPIHGAFDLIDANLVTVYDTWSGNPQGALTAVFQRAEIATFFDRV